MCASRSLQRGERIGRDSSWYQYCFAFFLLGHVLDTQIHAEFFTFLFLPFYIHSRIHPRPTPLVCWPNMALHTAQVCSAPRGGGEGGHNRPLLPRSARRRSSRPRGSVGTRQKSERRTHEEAQRLFLRGREGGRAN